MNSSNTKDPRNALSSWSGYEFQGQIALIVVLEKLIERKIPVEKCELMLEDLEDFSLYVAEKRISTHQVKATNDRSINNYKEALYKMAVSIQDDKNIKAFLHTSNLLDSEEWADKVKAAIERLSCVWTGKLKLRCSF